MEKAKLETPLVLAFQTVLGRHREIDRSHPIRQLRGGEVAPFYLEPAQHDDLDGKQWLRRQPRRPAAAPKSEPVVSLRQMQIGPVKKASGRLAAEHRYRTVL